LLYITEIYKSLQGESTWSGLPCTFIRLSGCNLRCSWCDTEYSFKSGDALSIDQIIQRVEELNCNLVEVTGGEPLAQEQTGELVQKLLDLGKTVLVETGGHMDIDLVSNKSIRIMDLKCPASKMTHKNDLKNITKLTAKDEVKFVIQNKEDFLWAEKTIREYKLEKKCTVIMSTVFGLMCRQELADLILQSGLNIRMQIQLHKLIWSEDTKGV
jgi:7-carboxy-7-deazaguanine synthase